ncbi:MAG: RHS repeat-associated core domain-containing protein [bacterium]|nr:RHS repeat-associated core domain-containing protein [bacterium]
MRPGLYHSVRHFEAWREAAVHHGRAVEHWRALGDDADYGYDPIDRFQSATVTSDAALSSAVPDGQYDDNGNIYSLTRGSGQGETLQMSYAGGFDLINSVAQDKSESPVCWDANGRVSSAPQLGAATATTNSLSYDAALGLTANVQVSQATSRDVTFAYGLKNRRVLKRVDDGTGAASRLYVHGPDGEVLAERTSDGLTASYVHGPRGLLAFRPGSAASGGTDFQYPLSDHIGSFYAVLGPAGDLVATYDYEAFGAVKAAGMSPELLRYLFTGQELDEETGLYNFKARLYDPWLARFYAPDPQHQFASPYLGDAGPDDPNGWEAEPAKQQAWDNDIAAANAEQARYDQAMARPKIVRFLAVQGPGRLYVSGAGVKGRIPLLAKPFAFNSKKLLSIATDRIDSLI